VHALRHIHAALRPHGLLLDVHPDATHSPVEIAVACGAVMSLGHLDDTQHIQDVLVTRAARQGAIDAGQFALESEVRFTFLSHFDNIESWLAYRSQQTTKGILPADLLEHARELLPPETAGEVRIPRQLYAARLRRMG
jgi:hypothetical protein